MHTLSQTGAATTSDPSEATCYLCGSRSLRRVRDHVRHGIPRNVLSCDACGFNFLQPAAGNLSSFYEGPYRERHSAVPGRRLSSRERYELHLPYQQARIDPVRHLLRPDMAVLDVGCSSGFFLDSIRPLVGRCAGIELDREDTAFARNELGLEVHSTPVEEIDLPEAGFDLITAFHVLEHLEDPRRALRRLRRFLKPDGHVYFEVPNVDDALLSIFRVPAYAEFWYREPHLFNFSQSTLAELMRQAGFAGETSTIQRYSLLNHLHWRIAGTPQASFREGTDASLVDDPEVDPGVREALNAFMARANEEYARLLNAHGLGDCVIFVGRKAEGENGRGR